jgi:glycosyltransferase involved in cell wall biosynthesis
MSDAISTKQLWRQPVLSAEYRHGLVSIIVPTHNRADLLPITIGSVKSQSYSNWEIVLVDDGSDDGTSELAKSWQLELGEERFRYVFGNHLGAQRARNTGMLHSRGEFIQFLDSDDLLHPEKLALQVGALKRDGSVDFSISSAIWSDRPEVHPHGPTVASPRLPITVENLRGPLCVTPAPLFRRSSLGCVGRWDEELLFCHESNFFGRALAHGLAGIYQADAIAYARTHPGRLCNGLRYADTLKSSVVGFGRVCTVAKEQGRDVHPELWWTILNDKANAAIMAGNRSEALRDLREAQKYHSAEFAGHPVRLRLRRILLWCFGVRPYRTWWLRTNPWAQRVGE